MSLITGKILPLVNSAVTFAKEPFHALLDGLKSINSWAFPAPFDIEKFRIKENPKLAKRIKPIIEKCGLDPEKIIVGYMANPFDYCTAGSVKNGHLAYLLMNNHCIEKVLDESYFYNYEVQFAITHELGHISADDRGIGLIKLNGIGSAMRMTAYGVTSLALSILCPVESLVVGLGTHLVGCTISKVVDFAFSCWFTRRLELTADQFCIKTPSHLNEGNVSREQLGNDNVFRDQLRKGGINLFKEQQEKNLKFRTAEIQKIADNAEKLPYGIRGIAKFIQTCFVKCNDKGEYRLDFEHPSLSTRIKKLQTPIERLRSAQLKLCSAKHL